MNSEFIICAAIWYRDFKNTDNLPENISTGLVITGRRHHNCIFIYWKLTSKSTKSDSNHPQGFLTNTNRFVNRKEAWDIAKNANQIIYNSDTLIGELYSEDLY